MMETKTPPYAAFGEPPTDPKLKQCLKALTELPPMDKMTMSGPCVKQTNKMESFMKKSFGFKNTREYFVDGVMAFTIKDFQKTDPNKTVKISEKGKSFKMTIGEILEWQKSFRCYYDSSIYTGSDAKALISRSLSGGSKGGLEAWKMKFAIRISLNPIFMNFDGKILDRNPKDPLENNIYLVSVCGHDFAGRKHDISDITLYIKNWSEVYVTKKGELVAKGRDFIPKGVAGDLNIELLEKDLRRMAILRLRAQDKTGIQIVGETGIGLGVFSGDYIGIGKTVRSVAAATLAKVLSEEKFENIKAVICALPIFKAKDNYVYFKEAFEKYYKGTMPVYIMDQDMHQIARCAAAYFKTSELNPADSHGVFGEYWQNKGPGTEEKIALTTGGLLTQHHAINPCVVNPENYIPMEIVL